MAKGRKTGGRQKGGLNKNTLSIRQVYEDTFENLGGVEAMTEWAKENLTEFYKLHAKLIPVKTELTGPDGQPIQVVTSVPQSKPPTPSNGH